jgi:hypothetical protein
MEFHVGFQQRDADLFYGIFNMLFLDGDLALKYVLALRNPSDINSNMLSLQNVLKEPYAIQYQAPCQCGRHCHCLEPALNLPLPLREPNSR